MHPLVRAIQAKRVAALHSSRPFACPCGYCRADRLREARRLPAEKIERAAVRAALSIAEANDGR